MGSAVDLDVSLFVSCSLAEVVVIGLLLWRHLWRTLPFFFAYNVSTVIGGVAGYVIYRDYPSLYTTAYIALMVVDSILLFGVLVELAWSILRPIRSSLPRIALLVIGLVILVLGTAIWPFASIPVTANTPHELAVLWHLQQTFSILRILIFLALASGSQLLSIGWRSRELQVATGLGFYSFISITIAILHTHQTARAQYNHLDRFVVASSLCTLLYWIFSFTQKEEERQQFSPQMQNFLLSVAGAARTARIVLTDSRRSKRN